MRLTFLGATQTVTGSKFLLEAANQRILIDCGLFQGLKALRLRNWDPPPIDPASVDAMILTQAALQRDVLRAKWRQSMVWEQPKEP